MIIIIIMIVNCNVLLVSHKDNKQTNSENAWERERERERETLRTQ